MAKKKDSETLKKPRKKAVRPETYQTHSDTDKALALLALEANSGNVSLTSRQLGISPKTLYEWAHGKYINAEVLKIQEEKRLELSGRLKDLAGHICDFLPSKMLHASAVQAATVMAIAIDKALALEGKSSNKSMSDDECLSIIAAVVERAKSRRSGEDATTGQTTPQPDVIPVQRQDTLDGAP